MARAAADGSRQMVKRSDAFIGIYARRYGSLHHDGRAIIEHEYDEATEAGMPKLCFILDESAPWPAELTESEPATLRLKAFLQRVQTDVIVARFRDYQDLESSVVAAVDEFLGRYQRRRQRRRLAFAGGTLGVVLLFSAGVIQFAAEPTLEARTAVQFPNHSDLSLVASAPNGSVCVVADRNGTFYQVDHGNKVLPMAHNGPEIRDLGFDRTSGVLVVLQRASDTQPGTISYWNGARRVRQITLPDQSDLVLSVFGFSPVEPSGILVDGDGSFRVFSMTGELSSPRRIPEELISEHGRAPLRPQSVSYSSDGTLVSIAYLFGPLVLFEPKTARFTLVKLPQATRSLRAATVVGNRWLVFSTESQAENATFELGMHNIRKGITEIIPGSVTDNVYWQIAPIGSRFLLSSNWSGEVAIWDVANRAKLSSSFTDTFSEKTRMLYDLDLNDDSGWVCAVSETQFYRWRIRWRSLQNLPVPWLNIKRW